MHVEHLDWLAKNPRYTQRFAMQVGKLCRDMPNQIVAEMERLHHSTVKDLDKLYMQKQVDLAGLPAPRAIGIDEISIRKGHNYRVIVSDLQRGRPIWVGGEGRKEADIDLFFKALGEQKSAHIELAAMDMWKPFRNSVMKNAPNARIIYDKFHIMRHLSKALDEVRRREYQRLSGKDRSYIKGQRYTLLSRRENLSLDGRRALKKLLQANKRLNTAYVLKESFGQLWDYRSERGARAFFERWEDSLKWQRLEPYRKFAKLIESHWDGIASYCHPDNKVSLKQARTDLNFLCSKLSVDTDELPLVGETVQRIERALVLLKSLELTVKCVCTVNEQGSLSYGKHTYSSRDTDGH